MMAIKFLWLSKIVLYSKKVTTLFHSLMLTLKAIPMQNILWYSVKKTCSLKKVWLKFSALNTFKKQLSQWLERKIKNSI
jgi:hypothetical protein